MSIKGKAYIGGIYEHPTRNAVDKSLPQLHAEVRQGRARGCRASSNDDVDGYFCAGDAPGLGALSMIDYLGLKLKHIDSTETGGSSYVSMSRTPPRRSPRASATSRWSRWPAGRAPRAADARHARRGPTCSPSRISRRPMAAWSLNIYAMCAMRHMHEFGTTSEQLAWIKVAASHHAQHNPHAMLRDVVTVEEVRELRR